MSKKIKTKGFSKEELETFESMEEANGDFAKLPDVDDNLAREMRIDHTRNKILGGGVSANDVLDENSIRAKSVRDYAYPKVAKKLNDIRKDHLTTKLRLEGEAGMERHFNAMTKKENQSENFKRNERYRKEVEKLTAKKKR